MHQSYQPPSISSLNLTIVFVCKWVCCCMCIYLNHHQHHSHFGTSPPEKKVPISINCQQFSTGLFKCGRYQTAKAIDQYNAILVYALFPATSYLFFSSNHPHTHMHTIFKGHHSFYSTFIILGSWWKCRKQQSYLFRWPPLHFIWPFTNRTIKYYSRYYCSPRPTTYTSISACTAI